MAPDASGNAAVTLGGRFELSPEQPLGHLDSPSARAFAAHDRQNADNDVFALVPDAHVPVRSRVLGRLKSMPETGLLGLRDYGTVAWPDEASHRFVLIYEHPLGWRLGPDDAGRMEPMSEDTEINNLLAPVVATLAQLEKRRITHRAIRPDNLFRLKAGAGDIILGECASAPAAYDQPPAYETMESLMADKAGRGAGHPSDDIYALGVTMLALLTGSDPGAGRGAAQLLAEKMTRGSYHTLVGGHTFSDKMRELLQGMVEDRREARWSLPQIRAWLSDGEVQPAAVPDRVKPERGFAFNGLTFYDPRALATAMAGHWDNVGLSDGGHEFLTWARQSLGDDALAERVLTAMELSKRALGGGQGKAHPAFVARLCMALDDRAPIRYKRISCHPDGLGPLLATYFSNDGFRGDIKDLFLEDLPGCQIRMSQGKGALSGKTGRRFTRLVAMVKDSGTGFGIERCLYELNPAQHCLSPLIADQRVMGLGDVLPALEKAAAVAHASAPMDRHLAAFIAARADANTDDFLHALNRTEAGDQAVTGLLALLAVADTGGGERPYTKLARWLEPHLAPAVVCFHHRKWREAAEAELPSVVASGNIAALYRFIANGEARRQDRDGYAEARARSAKIDRQIRYLNSALAKDPKKAEEYGHGLAVGLSVVVFVGAIAAALTVLL